MRLRKPYGALLKARLCFVGNNAIDFCGWGTCRLTCHFRGYSAGPVNATCTLPLFGIVTTHKQPLASSTEALRRYDAGAAEYGIRDHR